MPSLINNYYNNIMLYIRLHIGRRTAANSNNKNKVWRRGQVLLEYGVVLVLVVTALVAVQLYVQRGLQGRYKDATDSAIKKIRRAKAEFQAPLQYEPYYQESDITTASNSQVRRSYLPGGASSTIIDNERASRSGVRYELPYSDGAGD